MTKLKELFGKKEAILGGRDVASRRIKDVVNSQRKEEALKSQYDMDLLKRALTENTQHGGLSERTELALRQRGLLDSFNSGSRGSVPKSKEEIHKKAKEVDSDQSKAPSIANLLRSGQDSSDSSVPLPASPVKSQASPLPVVSAQPKPPVAEKVKKSYPINQQVAAAKVFAPSDSHQWENDADLSIDLHVQKTQEYVNKVTSQSATWNLAQDTGFQDESELTEEFKKGMKEFGSLMNPDEIFKTPVVDISSEMDSLLDQVEESLGAAELESSRSEIKKEFQENSFNPTDVYAPYVREEETAEEKLKKKKQYVDSISSEFSVFKRASHQSLEKFSGVAPQGPVLKATPQSSDDRLASEIEGALNGLDNSLNFGEKASKAGVSTLKELKELAKEEGFSHPSVSADPYGLDFGVGAIDAVDTSDDDGEWGLRDVPGGSQKKQTVSQIPVLTESISDPKVNTEFGQSYATTISTLIYSWMFCSNDNVAYGAVENLTLKKNQNESRTHELFLSPLLLNPSETHGLFKPSGKSEMVHLFRPKIMEGTASHALIQRDLSAPAFFQWLAPVGKKAGGFNEALKAETNIENFLTSELKSLRQIVGTKIGICYQVSRYLASKGLRPSQSVRGSVEVIREITAMFGFVPEASLFEMLNSPYRVQIGGKQKDGKTLFEHMLSIDSPTKCNPMMLDWQDFPISLVLFHLISQVVEDRYASLSTVRAMALIDLLVRRGNHYCEPVGYEDQLKGHSEELRQMSQDFMGASPSKYEYSSALFFSSADIDSSILNNAGVELVQLDNQEPRVQGPFFLTLASKVSNLKQILKESSFFRPEIDLMCKDLQKT